MKHLRVILAFAAGFGVATVLGIFLVRLSDRTRDMNTASDMHHPLSLAIESVEESASRGDCETAAAQLHVLKQRFEEYRLGGPTPAHWYGEITEVTAATRPAHLSDSGG